MRKAPEGPVTALDKETKSGPSSECGLALLLWELKAEDVESRGGVWESLALPSSVRH